MSRTDRVEIMKRFQVVTLFPEMFAGVFGSSMMWKAQKDNIVSLETLNLRDFGLGPRRTVDDTPYGGGDGMLLMIEPLWNAVQFAKNVNRNTSKNETKNPSKNKNKNETKNETKNFPEHKSSELSASRTDLHAGVKVLLMTPRGKRWNQAMAREYAASGDDYIFICGRYEGYDERILELVDEEISVGDYVLTGGELPAMTIIDSIVRLMPGVLGGETSAEIESFSDGETLEFPQYTRPEEFNGLKVPEVLLSGNHGEIARWRKEHSKKA